MSDRKDRWLRGRPVRMALFALGAAGALAFGAWQLASWAAWVRWTASADAVAQARSSAPGRAGILSFQYRGRTRFLTVPIDPAELAAARRVRTEAVFAQPAAWRAAYLRELIRSQSRTASVASIALQLRRMRDALGLDADEYVELIARAVQDIPYGTPRPSFDLPVQVAADGRAVCVDKSILMASVLVHEGYDAGVWALEAQHHVAVAVRGAGGGFRGTGYVFVETTRRAYVGEVPVEYAAADPDRPVPQLVVAGGARPFRADAETAFIVEQLSRAEAAARNLEPYRRYAAEANPRWHACYAGLAREQETASRLARRLDQAGDERRRVYALLTR